MVGGAPDWHDLAVTTAPALEKLPAHGSLTRPNMVSVGTIVWLSSELMFFAALFAMYFTIRSVQGAEVWGEATESSTSRTPWSSP